MVKKLVIFISLWPYTLSAGYFPNVTCYYSDFIDGLNSAIFIFKGEFDFRSTSDASSISGKASIMLEAGDVLWKSSGARVFQDPSYQPKKYLEAWRFAFDMRAVYVADSKGALFENNDLRARFLIFPTPKEMFFNDRSKVTTRKFDGYLDVNYHDQHGDYRKVECTQVSFPEKGDFP